MLAKRIIPCLDVRNGKVVKGVNFTGIREVDSPVELAKFYNKSGADELVFYDITATVEERGLFTDILKEVASQIFIPLTVGGGINTLDDFDRVLKAGADKVSVNSGAIRNPKLIEEAAKKYGDQCVVLSVDVKRVDGKFKVFAKGGRENTGIDAIEWFVNGQENGAGEVVVNSIDTDGVKNGFDLELLEILSKKLSIPIVASGGAGNMEHFKDLFKISGIDAGLAASIFHFKEVEIMELKKYLKSNGVEMRIWCLMRKILKKLKEINKNKYSILKLGLFGSFSKNSDNINSDIDILVKMEFKKGMYQNFCNLHKRLEEIFQKKVDLVDESMFEYKFKNPKVQKYKDEIKEEILRSVIYV